MSRLERIPVFDFETATPTKSNWKTPAVLASPSCQSSSVCDGGNADIGIEETSSSTGTSFLPPSLDDFCAVYEVFQCVWFQRKAKLSTFARSKRGPLPTPESKLENEERAPKTNDNSADRIGCSPKSTTKNVGSIESLVERSSSHSSSPSPSSSSVLDLLRQTYQSASSKDQDSWNMEDNHSDCDPRERTKDSWSPLDFLGDTVGSNGGKTNKAIAVNGYCSFVLQDDSDHAVDRFARRLEQWLVASAGLGATKELPYSLLVPGTHHTRDQTTDACSAAGNHHDGGAAPHRISVASHCWIFVGRNDHTEKSLSGRKEHTDAVAHDGTVHVQLEGRKVWHLRPTQELIEACDSGYDVALLDSYRVCPDEGDVLVINTRLWWHHTTIPPQQSLSSGHCSVSVSVARDLYLRDPGTRKNSDNQEFDEKFDDESNPRDCGSIDGSSSSSSIGSDSNSGGDRLGRESMSNVDASWAKGFIPRGTLLLIDRAPVEDRGGHDSDAGDDAPPRYYDRVPPSIGRTEHRSRANCRLVVRVSEDHDDENDDGSDNGNGDGNDDDDGDESGIQPRDSEDRALRPTNHNHPQDRHHNHPQERTDAKRKWIALETIRNIREGEVFVLLSRSESEIEEEDL